MTYKFGVFLGIPIILFLILHWLGFDGLYGQDSYEYLRYAESIQNYIKTGIHPGSFYWPVLYSFLGSLIGFLFGSVTIALHFITIVSIGVMCIYLFEILELLYPKNTKTSFYYIITFGLFSPYLLRAGLVIMSDMMSLLFIVLTFYHFFKSYYKNTSFTYVFLFGTCALMSRYATLVVIFPVIILAIYFLIKRRALKDLLIGSFLSILVCIPFVVLQWENLSRGTSNYFLNAWSISNYFKTSYETADGMQSYLLPNLAFVFYVFVHPGFFFIGLIAIIFIIKKQKSIFTFSQKIIASCIGLYLLFLAGIPFQNIRVLTLIFPLVLLFYFPAFYDFTNSKWIQKRTQILAVFCFLTQLAFCSYAFKTVFRRTLSEKELATSVSQYQGNVLYGFDYDVALKGRGLNFEYRNMYDKLYNDFKENELVLFNPYKLAQQWQGKNPMNNWNLMKQLYHLKVLKSFDDNWKLYQLKSKNSTNDLD